MTQVNPGPLHPAEVRARFRVAAKRAEAETETKKYDPKQPRGPHTGQWVKEPGLPPVDQPMLPQAVPGRGDSTSAPVTPDLTHSEQLGLLLEKDLPAGVAIDQPGTMTTLTTADAKSINKAVRAVAKKFPELTKRKKKGWEGREGYPFAHIEFGSEHSALDGWGQALWNEVDQMENNPDITKAETVGAGTAPDPVDNNAVKMLVNDDPASGDGIHTLTRATPLE